MNQIKSEQKVERIPSQSSDESKYKSLPKCGESLKISETDERPPSYDSLPEQATSGCEY